MGLSGAAARTGKFIIRIQKKYIKSIVGEW